MALRKPFSLFLSLRYLRPKRTFVSVITIISVLGVTLGVWILTTVIAIMTGYNVRMRETILGFEPHLTVKHSSVMYDWPEVTEKVKEHPAVVDAAPFSLGQVVLDYGNRVLVVNVTGLEPQPGAIFDKLEGLIPNEENAVRDYGQFDLGDDYAIIGRALADGMGIAVGDSIVLHSLANGRELLDAHNEGREPDELIIPAELEVVGIYDSGRHDYDAEFVFIPLESGQHLYNLKWGVHGIMLHIEDPYRAQRVKAELLQLLEPPLTVVSWIDQNRALFDAVALERLIMYFLLFMIMVVAGFCIMNTMITVTTQKRREIGLMKAVGAETSQIVNVFLVQGIVVGIFGTASGLVLAFLMLLGRRFLVEQIARVAGLDVFDPQIYLLYDLPAKITVADITVISGGAFLACALSALLPAYVAARLDAAKALRNESSV